MTTTSQPSQPEPVKDAPGSSPEAKIPATEPKEAKSVPLGEHIELRKELRSATDRLADLEKRLALSEKPEKPATTHAVDGDLGTVVKEIQRKERIRELAAELGLGDRKQGEAVVDLLSKMPDLTPKEALDLAANRNPDLFKDRGEPGFQAGIHGSMRPTPGTQPEPQVSDYSARQAHIAKTADKVAKTQMWNNWVGSFAAKAVGRPHQLIKIPK